MSSDAGFPNLVGHQAASSRLRRALSRGQLHHALLFCGPSGVGKAALALALAKALHCPEAPAVGCNACNTCQRIDRGHHVGVEWLRPEDGARSISVAAARDVRGRVELAPLEGPAHVVIVDPAPALTKEAQNALLKTLEEPREGVVFILLAENPRGLLPTILSRSLPLRLGPLTGAEVDEVLERAAPEADPARREVAARLCEGRPGLALALLEDESLTPILAFLQAAAQAARGGPSAIFGGERSQLWQTFAKASAGPATGKTARERAAAGRTIDLWLLHLRQRVRGGEGLFAEQGAPPPLAKSLQQMHTLHTVRLALTRNANVRLAFEHALLNMSA